MILQEVLLLVITATLSEQCKYAKITPQHSACLSRNPNCNIIDASLSKSEKDMIVNLHNQYRSKIAQGQEPRAGGMPPAADMIEMVWDDELAMIAQKHAEQCNQGHSCGECRKVDRFGVGQNILHYAESLKSSEREKKKIKNGIGSWYDEVKDYYKGLASNFRINPSPMVGHFTQMVWAKSVHLRCGVVEYMDERNWNGVRLICNYGPAGNFMGQPVYKEGKACSACPAGSSCSNAFPGLCKMTDANTKSSIPNESKKGSIPDASKTNLIPNASKLGTIPTPNERNLIPNTNKNGSIPDASKTDLIPNASKLGSIPTANERELIPNANKKGSIPNASKTDFIQNASKIGSIPTANEKDLIPNTSKIGSIPTANEKDLIPNANKKGSVPSWDYKMMSSYLIKWSNWEI